MIPSRWWAIREKTAGVVDGHVPVCRRDGEQACEKTAENDHVSESLFKICEA